MRHETAPAVYAPRPLDEHNRLVINSISTGMLSGYMLDTLDYALRGYTLYQAGKWLKKSETAARYLLRKAVHTVGARSVAEAGRIAYENGMLSLPTPQQASASFSDPERLAADACSRGCITRLEIAAACGVQPQTVPFIKRKLYDKLSIHNKSSLTRVSLALRLIPRPSADEAAARYQRLLALSRMRSFIGRVYPHQPTHLIDDTLLPSVIHGQLLPVVAARPFRWATKIDHSKDIAAWCMGRNDQAAAKEQGITPAAIYNRRSQAIYYLQHTLSWHDVHRTIQ